jgi:hypothetical protein
MSELWRHLVDEARESGWRCGSTGTGGWRFGAADCVQGLGRELRWAATDTTSQLLTQAQSAFWDCMKSCNGAAMPD